MVRRYGGAADRPPVTLMGVAKPQTSPAAFFRSVIRWLQCGYPDGVPGPDRIPLLELLRSTPLSDEQIKEVVDAIDEEVEPGQAIDRDVIAIFDQLYRLRYPIEKMQTVDHYADANDELSMEDNNTSAFNCRLIPGTDQWSPHAYGRAIDINTLLNPCLYASGYFEPQNAAAYLDRSRTDPGLLHNGDPAVLAFTDRGWRWGGDWNAPLDYQHFERP